MDNNAKEAHEQIRKDLWVKVAIAYVNSSNSTKIRHAKEWADEILSDFDERFKTPA